MANMYESELELEQELEGLGEFEHHEQHELTHEFEQHEQHEQHELHELAHEFEQHELENEFEQHEQHEQHELAHEFEQHELESEFEGEEFFKRIARGIGRFVRRAAPILRQIAKVAAPMVGTAIGGPFGAVLGRVASSALGEGELEQHELHEFEQHEYEQHEFEHHELHEFEQHEGAHEAAHEIAHHELTQHEAIAHEMAAAAAHEQHEGEAEAMAGAAAVNVISPADRRALRRILPHLVRGVAILTRILRRRSSTRPAVRAVPTIVRRTVQTLKRQAAAGQPITRRTAARAAATQVRQVLGNPGVCAAAIRQNVRAGRTGRRPMNG